MHRHIWIRAERKRDRERARSGLALPPSLAVVDAHRRLRGPYTAAGTVIREIVDDLLARCPELGERHNIELLTSTPETAGRVPVAWHTLEWAVEAAERTRYYSRLHTRNLANGLAELLRDYLAALGDGPRTLVVENAHLADATDHEFLSVLLRRGDLPLLTVVVGTGVDGVEDPPGEIDVSLASCLEHHTRRVDVPCDASPSIPAAAEADRTILAKSYVDGDCTSDDPALVGAYEACPETTRRELHDARSEELAALPDFSLHLGAVPFHLERGSDAAGAGVTALRRALDHCRNIGLYQAAADLGYRGIAVTDPESSPEAWWHFLLTTGIVLASVGRAAEAEALYVRGRAATTDALTHLGMSYSTAMLHARHYPEAQRDYTAARAWMNQTITIAELLPEPKQRAFQSVFAHNGLALVEVREKHPQTALAMLNAGMARLDRELEPEEHALHRLVLRYNRAQVYGGMGRWEEALADYTFVTDRDPRFPEHHFNIGNILRRLGRDEEALTCYRRSLELSPPYPEAWYNIADTLLTTGDDEGALEAFDHVLELDTGHLDALVNRAALLADLDRPAEAMRDVDAGLALAPDDVLLLCLRGRLLAERGEHAAAVETLTKVAELDPRSAEAWAIRGSIAVEVGELSEAGSYLSRAIELDDRPETRFNRAVAYEESGLLHEALADYDAVLASVDDEDAREGRRRCLVAAGDGRRP
ncbi:MULTISPECIES: tetratricopeptide repeat protein [Actinoalloteichus]|uniref:TPR repeat-containing protein n=1 Tax=Actinoalloteichus fjordicus TaxID=1612552 RepID=A0AAC9LFF4_9PSEU|nr:MULTISPECIES: tetratricopeptide repeat protein [Actinoalloteichus]APU15885.1 TPR repeat-containing protein [Actinoalloteichus fjordicus]APU21947.1 TPR repeat-containing protein [Actinoalloteichus sp. GBA129-24]